ncbi:MAG: S41 family peptidase [Candidatus Omnitrophica bacterium]|nr:S41 family peptidase [Candidatus Omnitrophota bacterium]
MMKRWLAGSIAAGLIFLSAVAMGGFEKTVVKKAAPQQDFYNQAQLFAEAINILRNEYVEEVDSKKLIYGAMKGMLESLDDFSQFLEPDEYNEIKVETKGEFGGVGVEITLKEGILTVIAPIAGTPAEAAGMRAGDRIVKIDGKSTKKITLDEAVKKMRGKPGTVVTLTVWREGPVNVIDIPIKRDIIKIRSIKKAEIIEDRIGYIKLAEFQENTPRDLDEAIKKLKIAGMDSLILDLRNNPGGLLDGAVDIAERFLGKGKPIVSIKARDPGQNAVFKSGGRAAGADFPMIVMVNEGSASASEIVAGAIKDNKRGIILGAKTFGKASVQTLIPLRDGSALRITTAYYQTPDGKMIKGEGITPDVIVASDTDGKSKAEDIFEKVEKPQEAVPKKDNQLDAAVNLMKAIRTYGP